ncbi:YeeE/YedE family protein [Sneathiella aquimaris]|uniref:YeeE/YedE family protein n=1 Tax=Sneathiella aquimaris TaxID=2599305 RepID=UPI00146C1499|nr:YeeE/YedE family protein [Sneathiella aquimaris]
MAIDSHLDIPGSRRFAAVMAVTAVMLTGFFFTFAKRDAFVFFVIALAMGLTLYHASYSFSAAYRKFFTHRQVSGIDSHLLLVALTTILFAPVLSQGFAFDAPVTGAIAPAGVGMAFGAFIFGIGMQLGGACASGSLYTAGSGNPRMMIVLVFFCAGAFWGSLDLNWWQSLPSLPAISLAGVVGWELAVPIQLAFLGLLYFTLQKYRTQEKESLPNESVRTGPYWTVLLKGPWPLIWAAVSLAVLNWLTLVTAGHPWSITWGFTLWGAKVATFLGWDPATSVFWADGFASGALRQSVWHDTTSVMNVGIMIGATAAMLMSRKRSAKWDRRLGPLIAAIVGGLMLGYGARLAYGCNIGAFISGAGSTSLHGWVWILCAFPGNWIGTKIRQYFQLN